LPKAVQLGGFADSTSQTQPPVENLLQVGSPQRAAEPPHRTPLPIGLVAASVEEISTTNHRSWIFEPAMNPAGQFQQIRSARQGRRTYSWPSRLSVSAEPAEA